ncbi:subtilisin-like protease [Colletotrichum truncatum]|uniref:Subtilisin-like protease n=1 Tax=Colletotrichum truncatum TaxID=5467 RepID=A0ACC3YEB0_COLTU|nr:subtilisin-like protease [Colletotrichum truncatum]KAF6790103.1 subtilisin-like protease [Colletotrichum truncatum]
MSGKLLVTAVSALLLTGFAQGQGPLEGTGLDKQNVTFSVPRTRFVVEFSDSGSAKFRKRDGSADTEGFYEKVQLTNNTAQPALNFTSDIFHGASFELLNHTTQSISEIEALPEVKHIWPVSYVYAPTPEANDVGKGPQIAKWDPHVLTKVNDAHKLGFDGKDVIVAVVDSGIDYTHPDLGGGFGKGFKVESGWDFVGDNYAVESPNDLYPDDDPKDCQGHGTHVAGIIASSNKDLPGVAPNARLRAYKVFGCGDGTTEDVIAQAFIQAYEDGADIITASLGSDRGFAENVVAQVITKITAKGTFVSAAAGNSGARGPYFTSSLANGFGGLTVGSVQHTQQAAYEVVAKSSGGESRTMYYINSDGTQWNRNGTFKAYIPPVNRDFDICFGDLPVPDGGIPDDDILVLPRGKEFSCQDTWQLMDSNLIGITKWVFFYNYPNISYQQPDRSKYRDDQPIGFATINYEDGIWIEEQEEGGHSVEFEFVYEPTNAIGIENSAAAINDFSSWGATLDGRMKPEISAPGGRILSTWPVSLGNWAVLSGTSMATPYIAGVAALYFNSIGGRSALSGNAAEIAHRRLVASGSPIRYQNGSEVLAPVAKQGAGLVDALKVVALKTVISPANINLNDTSYFSGKHTITIENHSDEEVTYFVAHQPGSTTRSRERGDAWVASEPLLKTDQGLAIVELSAKEVKIPAKGSATVDATFTEPSDIDAAVLAMYGGYINVVGSNGEAVRVTYMGIKGSLFSADVWEIERGVPVWFGPGGYGDTIEDGKVFAYPSMPEPYFNVLWSTREFSFDLVRPDWNTTDWTWPLVSGKNNHVGITTYYDPMTSEYFPFPSTYIPRPAGTYWLSLGANLTHGEAVVPGEYCLLARALRTYGDYANPKDWQFRLSPRFVIAEPEGQATTTSSEVEPTVAPTVTPTVAATSTTEAPVTVTLGLPVESSAVPQETPVVSVI